MPAQAVEGSSKCSSSWAAAALATAASPPPPLMAPVRRSEMKGMKAKMQGWPGESASTTIRPARHSARPCARAPASDAGLVAPAWPAEQICNGMP